MNILELQNVVKQRMKRPDLAEMIESRVIGVVKQLHGSGYYAQDRVEEIVKIQQPSCRTKLTLPPFWRKFVTLVPMTDMAVPIRLNNTDHQDFDLTNVQALWATDDTQNCYYVSLNSLMIKSEVAFNRLYCCYFKYPDLRDLTVTTWITEHYDQLCVDYTLASIYTAVGNKDLAETHRLLASEMYKQFVVNAEHEGIY